MLPWLWIFSPVNYWYWPLSGAVRENISPELFFGGMIQPGAGDPEIERHAFELASYGKQLGWLTDVVVGVFRDTGLTGEARKSFESLRQLSSQIQHVKDAHHDARRNAAIALLDRMEADSPGELRRVLEHYGAVRALPPAPRT
jgi:hypothetical protein